jgi:peptidoglycan/LPS O-acetylase OafA/YrhL
MARTLADVAEGRENNLTFLRLVAACAVIYGHSYAVTVHGGGDIVAQLTGYAFAGGVAVDLFFLISGYLVCASIRKSGLVAYAVSRALRIYPALIVHMILLVFVMGLLVTTLPAGDYLRNPVTWSYFLGLTSTTQGAFFLPGVFEGHANAAANGSIWSILIEVRLYLVLAVLYVLGVLRSPAVFNALFFVALVLLWKHPEWLPDFAAGRTNAHVCFLFAVGSFLQLNKEHVPLSPLPVLATLMLCAMFVGTDAFAYTYTMLVITIFLAVSFGTRFAWMDRIGDYSYGVYLYGWPVQQLVVHAVPQISAMANATISIAICLVLGAISWHLVERPMLRRRHGLTASIHRRIDAIRVRFAGQA